MTKKGLAYVSSRMCRFIGASYFYEYEMIIFRGQVARQLGSSQIQVRMTQASENFIRMQWVGIRAMMSKSTLEQLSVFFDGNSRYVGLNAALKFAKQIRFYFL